MIDGGGARVPEQGRIGRSRGDGTNGDSVISGYSGKGELKAKGK